MSILNHRSCTAMPSWISMLPIQIFALIAFRTFDHWSFVHFWHAAYAVYFNMLVIGDFCSSQPSTTSNWEHFHLSCLKVFDQMLSHQWLIIRNQLWLLAKAQWNSKCDCKYATVACTALVLDINKVGINLPEWGMLFDSEHYLKVAGTDCHKYTHLIHLF